MTAWSRVYKRLGYDLTTLAKSVLPCNRRLATTPHTNNMASEGTYVLKCNENYDAWLKAVGVPAELAAKMNAAKPTLEVTKIANGLTVKTTSGDKTFTNSVVFGKDSDTDIAGLKYTVNVTETDTGYKGTIKLGSKSGTVAVENTATGFTQTVTVDGVTSKRCYTKQ